MPKNTLHEEIIQEGLFSKLLGKAIVFASGAGKEWKKVKKMRKDPEVRKAMDDLTRSQKEVAADYAKIMQKIYGDGWKMEL